MKLLFVHRKLGEFGGAEANIRITASELGSRGYTTALLYSERTGRNEQEWNRIFPQAFSLPASDAAVFAKKVVNQFRPQLIYLHHLPDLDILEALLECGVPLVRMVHDHSLYCMRSYKYNWFTRRICTRPFSPFCLFPCLACIGKNPQGLLPLKWVSYAAKKREIQLNQRCQHLLVYSDYLKTELLRNGFDPRKIDVCVPLCVDPHEILSSSMSSRNLILFAGQLIRGKGVDVLLQALAKVRTHFECAIIGDGSHRHHCERLCKRLRLERRVTFRGYLLPVELGKFYREASVFVMGSLWPEPFGMAGPEAMRYGLPVVAFDAGGIREWLTDGENGFLIPWKNVDLFASRLEQLLRDKAIARQLGRRAFETIQHYDSGHQVTHLEQIFHAVAQAGKPALTDETTDARHLPAL